MEKRRQPRITVDKLKITGKMIFANSVEIIDISVGGISFTADRRLNLGSEYTLQIEENKESISLKGTIVWSKLKGSRKTETEDFVPIYAVGMKFADMTSEKLNELVAFIEAHTQRDPCSVTAHGLSGTRFNMRFNINIEGETILVSPASYTVKKISMAGMLIESKFPLEIEERLPMEFELPGHSPVCFLGRVASCIAPDDANAGYAVGIEFINMPEEHNQKLREFINRLNS